MTEKTLSKMETTLSTLVNGEMLYLALGVKQDYWIDLILAKEDEQASFIITRTIADTHFTKSPSGSFYLELPPEAPVRTSKRLVCENCCPKNVKDGHRVTVARDTKQSNSFNGWWIPKKDGDGWSIQYNCKHIDGNPLFLGFKREGEEWIPSLSNTPIRWNISGIDEAIHKEAYCIWERTGREDNLANWADAEKIVLTI